VATRQLPGRGTSEKWRIDLAHGGLKIDEQYPPDKNFIRNICMVELQILVTSPVDASAVAMEETPDITRQDRLSHRLRLSAVSCAVIEGQQIMAWRGEA
jgi:hypothetical protein